MNELLVSAIVFIEFLAREILVKKASVHVQVGEWVASWRNWLVGVCARATRTFVIAVV